MRPENGIYTEVFQRILEAESVLITFHRNPDGDSIGSAFALYYALVAINKRVVIVSPEPPPFNCRFLDRGNIIRRNLNRGERFDLTFLLDLSEEKRVMEGIDISDRLLCGYIINIDHHRTGSGIGDLVIQEQDAAATGEIIYRILRHNNVRFNKEIATALYTAIIMDTGGFRYSNTTVEVFEMASYLLRHGVVAWEVAKEIYESEPKERILLLGDALSTLRFAADNRIAYMCVSLDMLNRCGATDDMTDQFVNYARSIDGVTVGILFRETSKGRVKVSLRSKGDIDVATFSLVFGGGGHKNAAGIVIAGTIEDAVSKIIPALSEHIR